MKATINIKLQSGEVIDRDIKSVDANELTHCQCSMCLMLKRNGFSPTFSPIDSIRLDAKEITEINLKFTND